MKQASLFAGQAEPVREMTAIALVEDIFRRPQPELPGNVRRITGKQLTYLRSLIEAEYGSEAWTELHGKLTWLPAGNHKYVIDEDRSGDHHTVTRLSLLSSSAEGAFI